jgi:hypothetical protein
MIRRITAAAIAAFALALSVSVPAHANPGPGESFACAPGQQGNPEPGFKPEACAPAPK